MTTHPIALLRAEAQRRLVTPREWRPWLRKMFPEHCNYDFAPHHEEFWDWLWAIEPGVRPRPFVGIWARRGAKSSSVEMSMAALGGRGIRKYVLYVSATQDQADDHVATIGSMMTSQSLYPELAERKLDKFGTVKGWRRNRLWTADGFVIDALGLEVAARGMKLDDQRPDCMVFDDIDSEEDNKAATEKKIRTLTRKLLPAGAEGLAVIAIQNLLIEDGVFGRLASDKPPMLADRKLSGPIPALRNIEWNEEVMPNGATVELPVAGEPTWEGQDLEACRKITLDILRSAFEIECQHDVGVPDGGMFTHVKFRHEPYSNDLLRSLDRVVCWVDPAVSDTDRSDANGIQIDGIRGQVKYRLFSWEQRSSPLETLKIAISKAMEYGAQHVGVETDQGGDTWRSVYRQACQSLGITKERAPSFTSRKAGAGFGSKQHRAQQMLTDYERGRIVHVTGAPNDEPGTHDLLEKALRRFPVRKPYDLVDAAWHSWYDLTRGGGEILYVPHPTRSRNHTPQGVDVWPFDEDMTREQRLELRGVQEREQGLLKARQALKARYK